jgi:TP901 family phage tail tape measure protein
MAIKIQELAFILRARDRLSPVLRRVTGEVEHLNAAAKGTANLREAAGHLAMFGAGALAAAGTVGYALDSMVKPAIEWQAALAHVATTMSATENKTQELAQLTKVADQISAHSVLSAEALADAYYNARMNLLGHADALAAVAVANKLVIGTTENAAQAQASAGPVMRMLTAVYQVFGDRTQAAGPQLSKFANQLTRLQTTYGFKTIGEVQEAQQYAMSASAVPGVDFASQNAALALISAQGKYAAEAGTAYEEFLTKLETGGKLHAFWVANKQGGLDLGATIGRIAQASANMTALQRVQWLHEIGFQERSIQGVAMLVGRYKDFAKVRNDLIHSTGANALAAQTRSAALDEQLAMLGNRWTLFKRSLGDQLIGPLTTAVRLFGGLLQHAMHFVAAYPRIAKFVVVFAAIAAALMAVVGAGLILAGGLLALGSFVPVGAAVLVTVAEIGAAVATAGALWATFGSSIRAAVSGWTSWLYTAGAHLMRALADGMKAAALYPVHEVAALAHKIRSYLPFSPAATGPLRDLHRVRIVQTIAESIKPAPMAEAIRRVAQVAAIAVPLEIGGAVAPAMGAPMGRAGGAVVVNYSPQITVNGVGGDSGAVHSTVLSALRQHSHELVNLIDIERGRRARPRFEE